MVAIDVPSGVIDRLRASDEPCIRYRTLVDLCGGPADAPEAQALREAIRHSERVIRMLSIRDAEGRLPGVYAKYTGAHWVLADLADIGYPLGDATLVPLRDQVYECWLEPGHTRERVVPREAPRYKSYPGVPVIDGRARRCASQEGNALYATLALGVADDRADRLAANLIRWQWPDGGWNCDRKAEARTSSFHETLLPLRGLAWHARVTGSRASREAAERSAEFLLSRRLFRRLTGGSVIHNSFLSLRYPHYWHYDILIALKVMVEAGFIHDPRCAEALDLVAGKALPEAGWRAEGRHYKVVEAPANGGSLVEWDEVLRTVPHTVSRRRVPNLFVTLDALYVLRSAGRLAPHVTG
jgi:hypothetical protein